MFKPCSVNPAVVFIHIAYEWPLLEMATKGTSETCKETKQKIFNIQTFFLMEIFT